MTKRQVRAPKVYIRDSGLLHALLGVRHHDDLAGHPKVGASWEGFVIEQLLARPEVTDPWFWATHAGAEIDLMVTAGGHRVGVEVKRTDRPSLAPSMRVALADLELDHIVVAHAGTARFPLAERITAVPAAELLVTGLDDGEHGDGAEGSTGP